MRIENNTIHRHPGAYCGWPANVGIWSWGDEILAGWVLGKYQPKAREAHEFEVGTKQIVFSRSYDAGQTWGPPISAHSAGIDLKTCDNERGVPLASGSVQCLPNGNDLSELLFLRVQNSLGPTFVYHSTSRGLVWDGPALVPGTLVSGRTSYLREDGLGGFTCFMSRAKQSDSREGEVFCARLSNGTWTELSQVGSTPDPGGYRIMPSAARFGDEVLCAVRHQWSRRYRPSGAPMCNVELYASDDGCSSWRMLGMPVQDTGRWGSPAALVNCGGLAVLIYAVRSAPYRIAMKVSEDVGRSWSQEIVLRESNAGFDIGYPVATVIGGSGNGQPDAKILAAYYFKDSNSPEQFIGQSLVEM